MRKRTEKFTTYCSEDEGMVEEDIGPGKLLLRCIREKKVTNTILTFSHA